MKRFFLSLLLFIDYETLVSYIYSPISISSHRTISGFKNFSVVPSPASIQLLNWIQGISLWALGNKINYFIFEADRMMNVHNLA